MMCLFKVVSGGVSLCESQSVTVSLPAGIFAFKCVRAEEMFNVLQDIMHNNSISVVEEQVVELNPIETTEMSRKPHTAAAGKT